MKNCLLCNKEFEPRNSVQIYCNPKHQSTAKEQRAKELLESFITRNSIKEIKEAKQWALIGQNSSNDAMREAVEMLSDGEIKFKQWDKIFNHGT